jgi:serine/threonine protein kinase/CHASE2 domain-containing sensor protein
MKECPRCLICLDDSAETCPLDSGPLDSAFPGDPVVDGKYRVEHRLGRGGMGVVYRVRHLGLQRRFALKLILGPHEGGRHFLERFQTEARALGRLKHPNIVEVTDYGVDPRGDGLPYLVMEYLEGRTLYELCRRALLPMERALSLLDSIAQAIDYAHREGVLHCDLKPNNVLVVEGENSHETAKILDFGLARLLAAETDVTGVVRSQFRAEGRRARDNPSVSAPTPADAVSSETSAAPTLDVLTGAAAGVSPGEGTSVAPHVSRATLEGTLPYIAPELILGSPHTSSTDIYAFAVLSYETLVGKQPFSGSRSELVWKHLQTPPPVPSQLQTLLPPELDAPLRASLDKVPERRAKKAKDLVASLRSAWQVSERRKWSAREIPRRSTLAVIAGTVLALLSWPLSRFGWVEGLERRTVDARFAVVPTYAPDNRLVSLVVDEASLAADPAPLAEKADQFAVVIDQVYDAGARGVAIDFLLPARWAHSEKFSKLLLTHANHLTLAALSTSAQTVGQECVSNLTAAALGPERFTELFGFVNLREDPDGITRRASLFFVDVDGALRKSWAASVARDLKSENIPAHDDDSMTAPFWIDYSADQKKLAKISWRDVPAKLQTNPSLFQGRLVLLGGDLVGSGDDYHRIPSRGEASEAVSGLALQSLIVNTILADFPVRQAGWIPVVGILAIVYAAILAALLCLPRLYRPLSLSIVLSLFYLAAAFLLFRQRHVIAPIAGPLLLGLLALTAGLVLRLTKLSLPSYVEEA